ncbi:hypothetical protein RJT34_22243 [Clitoria ternatea]|uniref:CBM20 domain-containing protein n=1 Tax=Clitoria ternatea TaxID=43366 RepID=A0AAN9IWT2_CLITE
MKALTSSCSKIIVESLVSLSPRVSDRPEFCFSLRSRNDRKGSNFWLLKLVHHKGTFPVHAVPPKDQVDLETAEPHAEQSSESKFVRVAFQLQKDCDFGEQFLVVGDDPMLGSWDPSEALPMTWSDGHVWTVELDMPAGKLIQFKFILKDKGGNTIWQPGSDRTIQTWETKNRISVCEDWGDAALQNIIEESPVDQLQKIIVEPEPQTDELQKKIEEDQLAQSNEESQVVSEVSTFGEILDSPQERLQSSESEISTQSSEEPQVVSEMSTFTKILDSPEERLESNESKVSGDEDTQTNVEEKPLAEPVVQQITVEKPLALVAENIGSSEDLIKSTNAKTNMVQQSEESADGSGNEDMIHDLRHNGNAAPLKNQESTIVESSLFDYEEGLVLVPGLIPLTMPTEEAGPDEVQDKITLDTPSEAFETQEQNLPEFSNEQESNDGAPQEINATTNSEPELLEKEQEEQSHVATMEEGLNYQPDDGYTLQDDIVWGHETVKKFLNKLGLLG